MNAVTASADISCETVAAISPGDAVKLGDEYYEWQSALNVVDATDTVEWDVRFGENWRTREITVEGVNGGKYTVRATFGGGKVSAKCYRHDGDDLDLRGEVLYLTRVDETDEDEDEHAVGDELPDDLDDEEDAEESEVALPDGLTTEDVEGAVESNMEAGRAYLTDVADELDISRGKARTILVRLDLYSNVSESTRGAR